MVKLAISYIYGNFSQFSNKTIFFVRKHIYVIFYFLNYYHQIIMIQLILPYVYLSVNAKN